MGYLTKSAVSEASSSLVLPVCVHPAAGQVEEHEHQKGESVVAVVEAGQHQEEASRGAPVCNHVQYCAKPRSCEDQGQFTIGQKSR